ncbi:hypothetical protein N7510_000333 [Penicillium lagena]|uniref:uncharacterized protein n=1 Tax=Penicillium lagena TaxID=94218 RepID=UPI00254047E2|nr:uncharacterized protein N7510_000333 [Penicillium lagena]KAJ5624024.1 hypothetical protein N7510_000333 [Penicillium lagena]
MASNKLTKVNHAAGIFADMSVDGPAIGTLVAIIDRAKNLPNRKTMGKQNPYCAARLGKEAKKTATDMRGGQTPRWDFELRFTVHESPDYFKLKVSVFNDDKKTDLIGETWVDLHNLIIPGGSQNDHWHTLQCRGRYAGEIRIEMTYYDTREQDEMVIERRKVAAERVQGKPTSSLGPGSSGLSGPRQLEKIKRRPLPTDPTGAAPARPATLEKTQSAPPPLHHPMPSRPVVGDHTNSMPPAVGSDTPRQPVSPPPRSGYDAPEDYQDIPQPAPMLPPAGMIRRATQELPYPSDTQFDSRSQEPPSQHDFGAPRDQRPSLHEMDGHARNFYEPGPRSHGGSGHTDQPRYHPESDQYGTIANNSPQVPPGYGHELPPSDFARPTSSSGPADGSRYYLQNARQYHPEYANMQPRVEDEEEDGPPPPPPVHRSRMAQPSRSPVGPPAGSSFTSYPPDHLGQSRSQPNPMPLNISPSLGRGVPQDMPPVDDGAVMPPSLVAGYDPIIADDESERAIHESRAIRRRSSHFDDEMMISQAASSAPVTAPVLYGAPIYPLRTSPQPVNERPTSSRGGSVSPDTRSVTRKSVSPQPPSMGDRGSNSSIPYSPDSFNALNPNTSRAGSRDLSPAYDSPTKTRAESEPPQHTGPIIGDDGREIDPSDHLPTDTWAPEPEKKTRKPEVIIRFKHSARPSSRDNESSSRNAGPPRVGFKSVPDTGKRYTPSHIYASPDPVERTPPRGHESHDNYTHSRGYSTSTSTPTYRPTSSHRSSVSPTPGSRSPIYDYNQGPSIPSKASISQVPPPTYPVMPSNPNSGHPGMDALSRELQTINIGSAGCSPGRGATRKYAPRPSVTMGYAN